jgi:tetratricopeptide (TPR) repeat protein
MMNAQKTIGKIVYLKGRVILTDLTTSRRYQAKQQNRILTNMSIQTGPNSEVLIQLSNGTMKFLPESSKTVILGKMMETYLKTDRSMGKLTLIGGEKASSADPGTRIQWADDLSEPSPEEQIRNLFDRGRYWEVIQRIQEKPSLLVHSSQIIYLAAIAYFKVGDQKKSIHYFRKLLKKPYPEREAACYYGLFLNYIRLEKKDELKRIQRIFREKYNDTYLFEEMKKLISSLSDSEN